MVQSPVWSLRQYSTMFSSTYYEDVNKRRTLVSYTSDVDRWVSELLRGFRYRGDESTVWEAEVTWSGASQETEVKSEHVRTEVSGAAMGDR